MGRPLDMETRAARLVLRKRAIEPNLAWLSRRADVSRVSRACRVSVARAQGVRVLRVTRRPVSSRSGRPSSQSCLPSVQTQLSTWENGRTHRAPTPCCAVVLWCWRCVMLCTARPARAHYSAETLRSAPRTRPSAPCALRPAPRTLEARVRANPACRRAWPRGRERRLRAVPPPLSTSHSSLTALCSLLVAYRRARRSPAAGRCSVPTARSCLSPTQSPRRPPTPPHGPRVASPSAHRSPLIAPFLSQPNLPSPVFRPPRTSSSTNVSRQIARADAAGRSR